MTSQTLPERQAWFHAAITAHDPRAVHDDARLHLHSSPALDARGRLAIYRHSYRARLLQSFRAMYPGLLHALGGDMLDAFALDFLRHHPPRHHSVNRVADGFAAHLQGTRPAPERAGQADWVDFIVDLARIETALLEVSDAPGLEDEEGTRTRDVRSLEPAALLALKPHVAPCARLLRCSHPVHDYMSDLRHGASPDMPPARDTCLAVTRVAWRLATRELAPVQYELLQRLDGATPLEDALQAVVALKLRPAPTPELARTWLANFGAQGLVRS